MAARNRCEWYLSGLSLFRGGGMAVDARMPLNRMAGFYFEPKEAEVVLVPLIVTF